MLDRHLSGARVRACFSWPRPMCASANGCEAVMAEAFIGLTRGAGAWRLSGPRLAASRKILTFQLQR